MTAVFITAGLILLAQSQGHASEFEVSLVKPNKLGNGVRGGCHGVDSRYSPNELSAAPPLGRCVITGARLSHLIGIAFDPGGIQNIKDGPYWVIQGSDRFDIEAKAEIPLRPQSVSFSICCKRFLWNGST